MHVALAKLTLSYTMRTGKACYWYQPFLPHTGVPVCMVPWVPVPFLKSYRYHALNCTIIDCTYKRKKLNVPVCSLPAPFTSALITAPIAVVPLHTNVPDLQLRLLLAHKPDHSAFIYPCIDALSQIYNNY